jgi:recombinase-like zinc beta ribbon protein
VHRYQLTGLLVCGICGRRLQGHWVDQRPGYRCRHGHTTAHPADSDGPRWVYWSQTRIVQKVLDTANSELARCADAGQLAAHLRARDALIVCGPHTVLVEEAHYTDAQSADEVLPDGQLALPLSTTLISWPQSVGVRQRSQRPRLDSREPYRDPHQT